MNEGIAITMPLPRLSAILVSWNRRAYLEKAIQSLLDQHYDGLEIIVVDNGSTDDSREWLRSRSDIILIENQANAGAAAARNQGLRVATGAYTLFMDSDAELRTPGGLAILVQYLEAHPQTAGAAGIYYSDEELRQLWCWSPCMDWTGNHDPAASLAPKDDPPVLSTCFSIFRTSALREIGGFDEYFFYLYEDADLCERLRKRGYGLYVNPEVKILHHYAEPGRTRRGEVAYHYYHERLRMNFVLKNWGLRRFWLTQWNILKSPLAFLRRFPYLGLVNFLNIYVVHGVYYGVRYLFGRRRMGRRDLDS
ncbi:MAG TPA: glycosyltransferase family 2 protein [bacterium]|nr:glycosyltransferase family 2 protein [Candidatus Omnitrophota bacterium]HOJ59587.1 glycosyltransferase family 2 protein [bacterium]HOL94216.1 glycosyltransferase family 2 protein [bacterium]HPP02997.1 glycosyltransferase family 2 protein [bacterium]HXK95635.1 glycosyltransferase family 2 protein [bacterium]